MVGWRGCPYILAEANLYVPAPELPSGFNFRTACRPISVQVCQANIFCVRGRQVVIIGFGTHLWRYYAVL